MKIEMKDALGYAAVFVIGFLLYKMYKDNKSKAGFTGNIRGKRWRVGNYNPSTGKTTIINADNPNEVKFINGRINAVKDTIFS